MRERTLHNKEQLKQELATLQQCRHPNLITLLGYSTDGPKSCIVYEHKAGGALLDALQRAGANALTWRRRLSILLEVASGLEYLHTGINPPIVHRDVKTANILLDSSQRASLGDFGLARIYPEVGKPTEAGETTRVFGTPGYIDPEYAMRGKVTLASDVYSFGVVTLELLTSRKA
jgi:serine/threonine protein kinase